MRTCGCRSDEVGALSDLATMEFDFGTEERPAP